MDPQISWFQPEQSGPAKEFWMRVLEGYMFKRESGKSSNHDNYSMSRMPDNIENVSKNYKKRYVNFNHLSYVLKNPNKASTFYLNKFPELLIGKYGGCPWRNGSIYDSNPTLGLHQEIEQFYHYMSPTPEEHQIRINLVTKVKSVIASLWPNCKVEVFGSFQTALYLPTSDIDMVVLGEWCQLPLRTLQEALITNGICKSGNVKVLDKASVPIVKFSDSMSDIKVDISFNMNNGVKSVELIKSFCNTFPALKKLVLVLKQFLLQRDLNEVFHGGISSYSLILMCISFLQLHPQQDPLRADCNLGVLLIEFFELYGKKFSYLKTAISVKNGGAYLSKDELQKDMTDGHRPSILSIEDPLTPGNDIGRGSYGALQVKQAFEYAYIVITQAVSMRVDANRSSILGRVIRITDKVVDYRLWIKKSFLMHSCTVSTPQTNDSSATDSDSDGSGNSQTIPYTASMSVSSSKCARRPLNGMRYASPANTNVPGIFRAGCSANHLPNGVQKPPPHIGPVPLQFLHHHISNGHLQNGFHRQFGFDSFDNQKYYNSKFASSSQFAFDNHSHHHKRSRGRQQYSNSHNNQKNIAENSFG